MGRSFAPPFAGRGNGRGISSLRARDSEPSSGRGQGWGRGKGRKPLNSNFIKGRDTGHTGAADESSSAKLQQVKADDQLDSELGFPLFTEGDDKLGWLTNYTAAFMEEIGTNQLQSAVDCFFMCQDGTMFKSRIPFAPYFYLQVKDDQELEIEAWLRRKFEGSIREVEVVHKEDLDLRNHLSGLRRRLLKVSFWTTQQQSEVRREVAPLVAANKARAATQDAYACLTGGNGGAGTSDRAGGHQALQDALESIMDIREADVPYHWRFAVDLDVRCGHWYNVSVRDGITRMTQRKDLLQRAEVRICAFDIETTKLPLQFPNAEYDQVFMISYMLDKQGYLIVNREVVGADVTDFEYTPKPEYEGPFHVINEPNEKALLTAWINHMRQAQPSIFVTYNGDYFDWPFIETRCKHHDMDVNKLIGFKSIPTNGGVEVLSRSAVHMDCLHWVNRDSYLPQGSRGLKAVTKTKLGYDPVEVAPEDMVRMAAEQPQAMASYSVSDAVSTYYLYMTYIHPFIFSLATVIPMAPDEVLRKGSGTLCEQLLMVQAFQKHIVCPNKHAGEKEAMYLGHLLESETYIGGKVEAIESGVFRSDLPLKFRVSAAAYQGLIDSLDSDLEYALKQEGKMDPKDVINYDEIKQEIQAALEGLRDIPNREEEPLIYHLDVAAMYPNIILTNRLQPSATVTEEDCAACVFNAPDKTCLRQMEWVWRGEYYTASRRDYMSIKAQLAAETFPAGAEGGPPKTWASLGYEEQAKMIKDRLKKYCQKVHKRVLEKPVEELRVAGICQRENSFYVDTVRNFRDRRYEYKGLNKKWKGLLEEAKKGGNPIKIQEASDMCVVYDSLQLAHKCILNSFYGYVMRKGARWYSMEMAGVVTHAGSQIIKRACALVTELGRPLELDTDGIWCALPGSFPENFKFKHTSGRTMNLSYPCAVLNVMVARNNTNDQYQTLTKREDGRHEYVRSSEMSIEFEVDGPYKAMVLPASKEEGKSIKKRYAVFNMDGSLAELKGFEMKRRGELKLIKVFQAEVFEQFLVGTTLSECYDAVAAIANRWLDMLDNHGVDLSDEELLEHISEATVMSKGLEEYEGRKSCAITTAKRLAAFLGDERIKDKGLVCQYVIARLPDNQPTAERALPVSIFSADPVVARTWLRRWCGDLGLDSNPSAVPDVRQLVDWAYYRERLGSAIQKIITIPAAKQGLPNPVPRVKHPDWLHKQMRESKGQQLRVDAMFKSAAAAAPPQPPAMMDLEDMGGPRRDLPIIARARSRTTAASSGDAEIDAAQAGADEPDEPDEHDMDNAAPASGSGRAGTSAAARAGDGEMVEPEAQDKENVALAPNTGRGGTSGPARAGRVEYGADYNGWVDQQKDKWRLARQENKRRKLETAKATGKGAAGAPNEPGRTAGPLLPGARSDMGAILRQQAAAITSVPWHLVQLAETATPGIFKMWFVADSRLNSVQLAVPRTFYIASLAAPGDPRSAGLGEPVKTSVPISRRCHVYRNVMEETEFLRQIPQLATVVSSDHVVGVYEDRLPLAWRAVLDLGSVVKVVPAAKNKSLAARFSPGDFKMDRTEASDYDPLSALSAASLYHSVDSVGGSSRAVFITLAPLLRRALVVLVSPVAGAAREVTQATTQRAWREILEKQTDAAQFENIEFTLEYVRDTLEACRLVQRALAALREAARGAVLLTVQAPHGVAPLAAMMPILHEMPTLDVPPHTDDARYPPLQWQQRCVRRGLNRSISAPIWLKQRATLTKYARVPLGALSGEDMLAVADILFARALTAENHVLWTKDTSLPDLGFDGNADDGDARLAELDDSGNTAGSISMVEPGAYRSVSVELQLLHLPVCAVHQADLLAELEGGSSVESGAAAASFRVLRNLVKDWVNDAASRDVTTADILLQTMYRWLCNPASRLHLPALQRSVLALAHKLYLQLLAEMRKLGATIISATFNSIIICTGKRNVTAAVGYTRYLVDAIKRRELFKWLDMTPTQWWHALLYRDAYNWGGVEAHVADWSAVLAKKGSDEQGFEKDTPTVKYYWNLKEYLPQAVHQGFMYTLTDFVYQPWKEAQKVEAARDSAEISSQLVVGGSSSEDAMTAWLQGAVAGHFTDKLLHDVQEIARRVQTGSQKPEHQFQELAGSHLSKEELGTAALAFTRTICALMSLDTRVTEQVALLRRQLLKLLKVHEFSAAAEFKDPCLGFTLPDVICSFCNDCRDLDLCRDGDLQERKWHCRRCRHSYDLAAIEARLVNMLLASARQYQLQDLSCVKCKQVSSGHVCPRCTFCGGNLINSQPAAALHQRLILFRNMASFHGFKMLQEMASWLLEH